MIRRTFFIWSFLLAVAPVWGQRWEIVPDAGIVWKPGNDIPHEDHIEMSGERMAFVLRWNIDESGAFHSERSLVFPAATDRTQQYACKPDVPHGDRHPVFIGCKQPCITVGTCRKSQPRRGLKCTQHLGYRTQQCRCGAPDDTRSGAVDATYDFSFSRIASDV